MWLFTKKRIRKRTLIYFFIYSNFNFPPDTADGKEIYNKDKQSTLKSSYFRPRTTQILVPLMEFEAPWVRQEVVSIQVD